MTKLVFIFLSLFWILHVSAQNREKVNSSVFPHPVFVAPQPLKTIKGWTFYQSLPSIVHDVKGPALVGTYPGEIIKFQFRGNAVGIVVVARPDAGEIEFSVDEADWELIDFKQVNNKDGELHYFTLESGLKDRKHTLQIRMASGSNSGQSKCILSSFYFNNPE